MSEQDWLASQFEANRERLHSVAYRLLGSASEAEDVVQEAWLRLSRTDGGGLHNVAGWLTTVVARLSLDALRSRVRRREEQLDIELPEHDIPDSKQESLEQQAMLVDAMGPALLVVLEYLSPTERLAFVLHDLFGVSFEDIAPIVGRTPAAARQLASRGRRRVQGVGLASKPDAARQREIVHAFLLASRSGDFTALLELLDPDVVLRADAAAVLNSAKQAVGPKFAPEIRGARSVAETFVGHARAAQPALVDGIAGAAWAPEGTPRVVFSFTIAGDHIVGIEVVADAAHIAASNVVLDLG
ncbi:RNA polymerase subunit sigma-70 [Mesorhizobium loti]|uniref:RNA polymerase subunit sigma-70 n=1 Tax=Rhizobium loti TaxID=381 RepID=A0A101KUJ5_RHILI|nr:RNA polymerase subunit sigma-70 [Mesorhizobium loti]